jgi:hypothetical protein
MDTTTALSATGIIGGSLAVIRLVWYLAQHVRGSSCVNQNGTLTVSLQHTDAVAAAIQTDPAVRQLLAQLSTRLHAVAPPPPTPCATAPAIPAGDAHSPAAP